MTFRKGKKFDFWEGDQPEVETEVPSAAHLFEQDMCTELEHRSLRAHIDSGLGSSSSVSSEFPQAPSDQKSEGVQKFYDPLYFDSDDDSEEDQEEAKKRREFKSNDELLYDPDMDDKDEAWMNSIRRKYRVQQAKEKAQPGPSLSHSDAVLNCPACLSVLCMDCQRHEMYKHQYRAMFVVNCQVIQQKKLTFPEVKQGKKNKYKNRFSKMQQAEIETISDEVFHPVQCVNCDTQVAVFDQEEVYHFFNVVASHC